MGNAVSGAVAGRETPDYRVISWVRVRLRLISWPRLMSFRSALSLLCSITWLPFGLATASSVLLILASSGWSVRYDTFTSECRMPCASVVL